MLLIPSANLRDIFRLWFHKKKKRINIPVCSATIVWIHIVITPVENYTPLLRIGPFDVRENQKTILIPFYISLLFVYWGEECCESYVHRDSRDQPPGIDGYVAVQHKTASCNKMHLTRCMTVYRVELLRLYIYILIYASIIVLKIVIK